MCGVWCACYSQVVVGPLEERGFSLDMVDIFLDSSSTRLPLSSECVHLAGSVLHVRGTPVRHCVCQTWNRVEAFDP